jgi:hypothetical protein
MRELQMTDGMEKPEVHGSPSQKARKILGEKLNRPAKPPPPLPGRKKSEREPPARRVADEVDDL